MIYVLLCMMVGSHRYSASQKSEDNLHALDSVNILQTNRETNLDDTIFFQSDIKSDFLWSYDH